jgi:hypothetical protein
MTSTLFTITRHREARVEGRGETKREVRISLPVVDIYSRVGAVASFMVYSASVMTAEFGLIKIRSRRVFFDRDGRIQNHIVSSSD